MEHTSLSVIVYGHRVEVEVASKNQEAAQAVLRAVAALGVEGDRTTPSDTELG